MFIKMCLSSIVCSPQTIFKEESIKHIFLKLSFKIFNLFIMRALWVLTFCRAFSKNHSFFSPPRDSTPSKACVLWPPHSPLLCHLHIEKVLKKSWEAHRGKCIFLPIFTFLFQGATSDIPSSEPFSLIMRSLGVLLCVFTLPCAPPTISLTHPTYLPIVLLEHKLLRVGVWWCSGLFSTLFLLPNTVIGT